MKNELELKLQVAKNLVYYRKANNLTQSALASKLSYSDKAVSKWERGETLPDVYILSCLAELYGISVNDFLSDKTTIGKKDKTKSRVLISICSFVLVWFIATVIYITLLIINPNLESLYLTFAYALPVSLIVATVFASVWGNNFHRALVVSVLAWSIPLAICLTFTFEKLWFLFIIVVPFQILILFWFKLKAILKRKKESSRK